jgi:hypothetical protein
MNRKLTAIAAALAAAFAISATAATAWAGVGREKNAANMEEGSIGLGGQIGCGTGGTAKFRLAAAHSVQGTIGFGQGIACNEDLYLSADYLFELPNFVTNPHNVQFGWYVGVGGRYAVAYNDSYRYRGTYYDSRTNIDFGPRVPIGFEVYLTKVRPLELYVEAAPGIDFIDAPGLTVDIGSGARWFF